MLNIKDGQSHDATVLIVGAGPSGLAAAAELAHQGVGSLVLEPRLEVAHTRPRAKTTSARTMEYFRRWGVAESLREKAPLPVAWSQSVVFCDSLSGRQLATFHGVFGLSVERVEAFAECGQQVPQPVVEEVLRSHVAASPSVDLRLGWTAVDMEREDGRWVVTATDPEGVRHRFTAKYILGCDGAGSMVRKRIGAEFVGQSDGRPNFNVVFRAPDLIPQLEDAVQYWVLGDTVSGLLGRLDLAGTWWAILPGIDYAHGLERTGELLTSLVGRDFTYELIAADSWTARMLVADRFCRGTVFLVGEAAHLNPPWGGHGYNTSVGDAVNIAWKIAAVEAGWADPELLKSYEVERRAVVEQVVAAARLNMSALPGDLRADPQAIRDTKSAEFYSLGLVLGYQYRDSPVTQPTSASPSDVDAQTYVPSIDPGARLPHHWMSDGSSLYDHLGVGFTLLVPAALEEDAATLVGRAASFGMPLKVLVPPSSYPWREQVILVRPDQHIAWATTNPDEIDLHRVLARVAVPSRVS
jgi:2-polyprenyl-6-methoxyphenol hydroxylase-like FAD-dependent oxidoreductase